VIDRVGSASGMGAIVAVKRKKPADAVQEVMLGTAHMQAHGFFIQPVASSVELEATVREHM